MASRNTSNCGKPRERRAFNKEGHEVVKTRRNIKETDVATRSTRKKATSAPCLEIVSAPGNVIQGVPGVMNRAGRAIRVVYRGMKIQTRLTKDMEKTLDPKASTRLNK